MPPLSSYSSQLDGSLKIFAPNNTTKHGSGSILVQNGADFYGSDDQYLKSSNVAADLFVQSAKNLNATGTQVNVTGSSGAVFKATAGDVQLRSDAGNTSYMAVFCLSLEHLKQNLSPLQLAIRWQIIILSHLVQMQFSKLEIWKLVFLAILSLT
jgi:hypothetical protein